MPVYEYQCNSCGKQFEIMQKITDKPVKTCIHCSSKKVEKIISQSSFALKGSGFIKRIMQKRVRPARSETARKM